MYFTAFVEFEFSVRSVLWCCCLGDRNGIWPVKTSASKPLGMAVNVGRWGTVWSKVCSSRNFDVSYEDAQDTDDWKLGVKGATI